LLATGKKNVPFFVITEILFPIARFLDQHSFHKHKFVYKFHELLLVLEFLTERLRSIVVLSVSGIKLATRKIKRF